MSRGTNPQPLGFIRNMLDVKVLILYVMTLVQSPVTVQQIFELCYQDDTVSYFDVCEAVPQMVESGHLAETSPDHFVITDAGRKISDVMADTVSFPVAHRAKTAVERFNKNQRRSARIRSDMQAKENGEAVVTMEFSDTNGVLMHLELTAPSIPQGHRLENTFKERAESIYQTIIAEFLKDQEEKF